MKLAELNEARQKSAEILRQESLARVLVDGREADFSNLSLSERFQFNSTYQTEFSTIPSVRIAAVVAVQRRPESNFSETVARNRGTPFRVFVDWDQACDWLAEETND